MKAFEQELTVSDFLSLGFLGLVLMGVVALVAGREPRRMETWRVVRDPGGQIRIRPTTGDGASSWHVIPSPPAGR